MAEPNVFSVSIPALPPVHDRGASIVIGEHRAPAIAPGTTRAMVHLIEASAEELSRIKFKSQYPEITDAEITDARVRSAIIGREVLIGEVVIKDGTSMVDRLDKMSQDFKSAMEKLRADVRSDARSDASEDMKKFEAVVDGKLQKLGFDVRSSAKSDMEKWRADVNGAMEKIGLDIRSSAKSDMEKLRADVNGDMEKIGLDVRSSIKSEMES